MDRTMLCDVISAMTGVHGSGVALEDGIDRTIRLLA
jgi:hypothetical protein